MAKENEYADLLTAAQHHGDEGEDDAEVGDLQGAIAAAWELMTEEQRDKWLNDWRVADVISNWYPGWTGDHPPHDAATATGMYDPEGT